MQSTHSSSRSPLALVAALAVAVGLVGCSSADAPDSTRDAAELEALLPTADDVSAATGDDGADWTLARSTAETATAAPAAAETADDDGDLGICAMDFRSFTASGTLPSASAVFTRDRQQFTTGVVARDDAESYVGTLGDELDACPATTTAGVSGTESTFTLTAFEGGLAEAADDDAVCFSYAASFGGAPGRGHACQVARGDLVTLSWVLAPTDREGLDAAAFARLADVAIATAAS